MTITSAARTTSKWTEWPPRRSCGLSPWHGPRPDKEVDKDVAARVYEIYGQASERLYPRTPEEITRLLDGFELIEPEVLARHAQVFERDAAVSASPVGWRVLARKP